jgi:hypothetical protein
MIRVTPVRHTRVPPFGQSTLPVSAAALVFGCLGGAAYLVGLLTVAAILALAALATLLVRSRMGTTGGDAENVKVTWVAVLLPLTYGLASHLSARASLILIGALLVLTLSRPVSRLSLLPISLLCFAFLPFVRQHDSWTILVSIAWLVLALRVARTGTRRVVWESLVDGIALYLLASVAAHAVGLQSVNAGARTGDLTLAGGGTRIFYPFATSLAETPIVAALFLGILPTLPSHGRIRSTYRLVAGGAASVILVSANSEAAILVALIVAGGFILSPKFFRLAAMPAAVASLAFAFVFPIVGSQVVPPVATHLSNYTTAFERASSTGATLNGRTIIWTRATDYWEQHPLSTAERVWGFGAQGQYISGASVTFMSLLAGGYEDPGGAATAHSVGLQQLYDGGMAGFAVLLLVEVGVIGLLAVRTGPPEADRALLAGCLALVLLGSTEIASAPGPRQLPALLLFVMLACVMTKPRSAEPPALVVESLPQNPELGVTRAESIGTRLS